MLKSRLRLTKPQREAKTKRRSDRDCLSACMTGVNSLSAQRDRHNKGRKRQVNRLT